MCQLALNFDSSFITLFGAVAAILAAASGVAAKIQTRAQAPLAKESADNLVARIQSWWILAGTFAASICLGKIAVIFLFLLISFLALREMLVLTPVRKADHKQCSVYFFSSCRHSIAWSLAIGTDYFPFSSRSI